VQSLARASIGFFISRTTLGSKTRTNALSTLHLNVARRARLHRFEIAVQQKNTVLPPVC